MSRLLLGGTYTSEPSGRVAVIFDVEAELMPPPPADETEALLASIFNREATAGSMLVFCILDNDVEVLFEILLSMNEIVKERYATSARHGCQYMHAICML